MTGSIGVVGMKIAVGGGLEKLGIATHSQKRGRYADTRGMTRPLDAPQVELIRRSMLDIYGTFKKRITDGRGDRIKGDLEAHAGGRVFAGVAAKKIGLVDQIGGLYDAIAYTLRQAKLDAAPVYLLPEPKSGMEGLFGKPKKGDPNGEFIGAPEPARGAASGIAAKLEASGLAGLLDPWKLDELRRALELLEAAKSDQVMPC